jgi:hypothetical protein
MRSYHHVLDEWLESEVKPHLHGQSFLIRYADDAVLAFANEQDARRVLEVLPKCFERFGLKLHPSKTRLVCFKPLRHGKEARSFAPLGFTHYWGKSRTGRGPSSARRPVTVCLGRWEVSVSGAESIGMCRYASNTSNSVFSVGVAELSTSCRSPRAYRVGDFGSPYTPTR